jgi:hypothetical protein
MMKITERKPDPMVKKYHYNSIIDTERKPDPMVKKNNYVISIYRYFTRVLGPRIGPGSQHLSTPFLSFS